MKVRWGQGVHVSAFALWGRRQYPSSYTEEVKLQTEGCPEERKERPLERLYEKEGALHWRAHVLWGCHLWAELPGRRGQKDCVSKAEAGKSPCARQWRYWKKALWMEYIQWSAKEDRPDGDPVSYGTRAFTIWGKGFWHYQIVPGAGIDLVINCIEVGYIWV